MMDTPNCPDCAVPIGSLHVPGCDIERCTMCGCQMIGCNCIYEFNDIDPLTLEEDHPDLWSNGPTEEMYAKWDAVWDNKRLPWTGEYPGVDAARAFGWFVKWVEGDGWVSCSVDDSESSPDLNKLHTHAHWDAEAQKWVRNR